MFDKYLIVDPKHRSAYICVLNVHKKSSFLLTGEQKKKKKTPNIFLNEENPK